MTLISKSAFAKMVGVSPKSITCAITKGTKSLAPAVVSGQIDPNHEAARAYIETQAKRLGVAPKYALAASSGGR